MPHWWRSTSCYFGFIVTACSQIDFINFNNNSIWIRRIYHKRSQSGYMVFLLIHSSNLDIHFSLVTNVRHTLTWRFAAKIFLSFLCMFPVRVNSFDNDVFGARSSHRDISLWLMNVCIYFHLRFSNSVPLFKMYQNCLENKLQKW